ncbi:uroporphyrinogen decarboxylase family protein [bacterium]|nr:uroporphyrinogen decarboxylase family protein [bacterium]
MTSKERVQSVLAGKIPDRVPWGEWAVDFDTVGRILGHDTYFRAKAKSAIGFWEGRRDEVVQSWKEDGIEFFRRMDCFDIINISAMASSVAPPKNYTFEKPRKLDGNTFEFRDGAIYKFSDVTADVTKVYDPNAGKKQFTPADFDKEPVIEPPDESCFEVVDAFIGEFGRDRFLMGPSGSEVGILILGGSFEEGGGGFAHGLMEYLDNPETVKAAIRYEVAKNNLLDRHYIRHGQDAVGWGQDFSSTQGPFISPAMFREFVFPGIQARVRNIHEHFKLPVMKHACGNNNLLLDMFVEAGYDAYQSIQRTAGMDLEAIKERYGSRFVPWGGISVELLVSGTPDDVKREVAHAMEHYKPGGRYIFGSTHSIAVGTKYDNFMTMVDEFQKLRNY